MNYRAIEATNTKTRRLAYIQALVLLLKSGNFSRVQLMERIARWSEENAENLRRYWVHTGEITSTRQNSAVSRYIDLATSLGLIAPISGVYRYTRLGLVLITLLENMREISTNPFHLSAVSRLFFAYLLLARDADFLLLVTDYIVAHEKTSLSQMQREFKDTFVRRVTAKIMLCQDERIRRTLLDRRRDADNWKKPERYSEHLIPPRLNLSLIHI